MPAAMQGELQPTIYRFRFGDFEIANILDSKVVRDGPYPAFGGERPAEEAEALCRANRIDPKRYEHPFIPTLGMMNVARGLALVISGGFPISELPVSFRFWGAGVLFWIPAPVVQPGPASPRNGK